MLNIKHSLLTIPCDVKHVLLLSNYKKNTNRHLINCLIVTRVLLFGSKHYSVIYLNGSPGSFAPFKVGLLVEGIQTTEDDARGFPVGLLGGLANPI